MNIKGHCYPKRRQRMSAQSFLIKAIGNNDKPGIINMDQT
jgi:hypothetical protein